MPVRIIDSDVVVSNAKSLIELKNDIASYSILHHNGDLNRLYHALALKRDDSDYPFLSLSELNYIDSSECFFKKSGSRKLLSRTYGCPSLSITEKSEYKGFHKHRSVLEGSESQVQIKADTKLSDCLIVDIEFIVSPGVTLTFNSLMLDNVSIVLQSQSKLSLSNVEFSNNKKECIYIESEAAIVKYEKVRFFDSAKHFVIEKANNKYIKNVVDLENANAIIEFLSTSEVKEIELSTSFVTSFKKVNFNQAIVMSNVSGETLDINIQELELSHSFVVKGVFDVQSRIEIVEMQKLHISLSNFSGQITIHDSDSIMVTNTIFQNSNSTVLNMRFSNAVFVGCSMFSLYKPISLIGSSIKLKEAMVENVNEVFTVVEEKLEEDELLVRTSQNKCQVEILDTTIKSSLLYRGKGLETIRMKKLIIENCSEFIIASEVNIMLNEVRTFGIDILVDIVSSALEIDDMVSDSGNKLVVSSASDITMNKVSVTNYNESIFLSSSQLKLSNSLFKGVDYGVLLDEFSKLQHYKCNFDECLKRKLVVSAGGIVIDLEEYEELEKCQTT